MIPRKKLINAISTVLYQEGHEVPQGVAKRVADKVLEMLTPEIAKNASHPLRQGIMAVLAEAEGHPMSPSDLAPQLGAPLSTTAYHVNYLHARGVLKLVDTQQRRGATEHYYRLREE